MLIGLGSRGLAPEIAQFGENEGGEGGEREWWIKRLHGSSYDARYMLRCVLSLPSPLLSSFSPRFSPLRYLIVNRPETVESLFIAYRLTHDLKYRTHAWDIFSAIEKYCKIPGGGYATVEDVDELPVRLDDKQETFFLVRFLRCIG